MSQPQPAAIDAAPFTLPNTRSLAAPAAAAANRPAMFRAILYKEWIKLRLYWALLFIASLGFALFLSLRLRHVHQFYDAVSVWSAWIFKGYLFFHPYRYAPLAAGVVVGALQFLPETLNKRVRLALHLPLGEERVISHHLLAGLVALTLLLAPAAAIFAVTGWIYFPVEFQRNLALTLAPWLLAGYSGYLLTATLLLETTWRYRVLYLLLGGAVLRLFFLDDFYDVYQRVLPALAAWAVALFALPLFSSYRFRKGIDV
jgi:hypothetical protein